MNPESPQDQETVLDGNPISHNLPVSYHRSSRHLEESRCSGYHWHTAKYPAGSVHTVVQSTCCTGVLRIMIFLVAIVVVEICTIAIFQRHEFSMIYYLTPSGCLIQLNFNIGRVYHLSKA